YVVDRDGTILQATDPDLATVHLNIFKTLKGINNDNSIGIEMVHTGRQNYPSEQRSAVIRLTSYLQDRYKIHDDNVITHCYAQQGDHTDPVAFDWDSFLKDKLRFRRLALAQKMNHIREDADKWWHGDYPVATTYLQTHGKSPEPTLQPKELEQTPSLTQPPSTNAGSQAPVPELRGPINIDPKAASLLNAPDPTN
ncbi:MAG: N-acetylmuramoyl-L-alanine amidase, partial [Candidatus Melainabacteria bacterium]|nr:N-acetylmuramoyl-L-alanine amidase [Candidatus Melainabacteria bacterium]